MIHNIIIVFLFLKIRQMSLKIYHNPRCRKSREGLNFLKERSVDFEVIEYLKDGISSKEIKEILLKLHICPIDLVRKNEPLFKKELRHLSLTDVEWIKVISENPELMKRPVILSQYSGVIGDPSENIEKVL